MQNAINTIERGTLNIFLESLQKTAVICDAMAIGIHTLNFWYTVGTSSWDRRQRDRTNTGTAAGVQEVDRVFARQSAILRFINPDLNIRGSLAAAWLQDGSCDSLRLCPGLWPGVGSMMSATCSKKAIRHKTFRDCLSTELLRSPTWPLHVGSGHRLRPAAVHARRA